MPPSWPATMTSDRTRRSSRRRRRSPASLKLAIQQEANLAISTEAFITSNPNATEATSRAGLAQCRSRPATPRYGSWDLSTSSRPPGPFITRITADPPTPLAQGQTYQVTPRGNRPFYCLTQFWYANGGPSVPLGYDSCSSYGSGAAKILAQNISVPFAYVPFTFDKLSYLAVSAPVYLGGVYPPPPKPGRHRPRHHWG